MPEFKKYKFVFDYIQTRDQYPFYSHLINTTNGESDVNEAPLDLEKLKDSIHVVNYIPPFLQPKLRAEFSSHYKSTSFMEFDGYLADFGNYSTLEEYISDQMSSKRRNNLRRYQRRLESCFRISYRLYYGAIDKGHYELLLEKARTFIIRRFRQRGDTHELIDSWEFIRNSTYNMILAREASLFVIYNDQVPISICLSYHMDNIMHNAIGAFDIDYYTFRLGTIDIYKQMEWCFENGVKIFDLGLGDLEYKAWWCNIIYQFEHQVLFERRNLLQQALAITYIKFYRLKQYLKRKNIDKLYHRIKKIAWGKAEESTDHEAPTFELKYLEHRPAPDTIRILDASRSEMSLLRRHIYDFQYYNSIAADDIAVYEELAQENVYYILGKKKIAQLELQTAKET